MTSDRDETVLVTGGAGFIGSELVTQLAAMGRRVIVLDNLATGRTENLAGLPATQVTLVVGDVRKVGQWRDLLSNVSTIYHLACLGVRHSLHAPRENHDVNATATLALLEAARAAGVGRFVQVSSSEVYGTAQTVPMDERHPTRPHTVYGASKLAGEAYARAFHLTYGYPTVIVRPFNAFGPRSHHEGDSGEVIPRFLLRALAGQPLVVFGDGTQTRDFTEVSDTARGILQAGTVPDAIGQTLNLGSGREISIGALAAKVAEAAGRPDTRVVHEAARPGDVHRLVADARLAQTVLGFEPRVSFEHGLARLVEWYRQHGGPPEELLRVEVLHNWRPEERLS